MEERRISCHGISLREYRLNTVVVGTGAAGYNAADQLFSCGQQDIAVVTEGINRGTSRNTGSDKQTYYKLTLSGEEADSIREMAQTLFDGQCVDGDIALCEAALSAQGFLKLVGLGVPFPRNRWGEYIGYKTDHDPRRRATSVGPYTSKIMTECLQRSVEEKQIPVFDGLLAIAILSDGQSCCGLLCLDCRNAEQEDMRYVAFRCQNVIWATGGPAGIYGDSVYPAGHFGATGTAFAAGAAGKNLTEWQYGLASVNPRWNVSGTYMQVLPRFISAKEDGTDEREFLYDFFSNPAELLTMVFLKGYQWPFDVRKVAGGSSIVDILVYLEQKKGRKVFLDFRANPGGGEIDFGQLGQEALDYLQQAGACFGTPFERLLHMNQPAVEFYRARGVDLSREPLEIALCAQHNNGGLAIDSWWQTNVKGLFAAGEAAASHGVYRPGGSALNAGQVGSARAAQYIACHGHGTGDEEGYRVLLEKELGRAREFGNAVLDSSHPLEIRTIWNETAADMSRFGASIRSRSGMEQLLERVKERREGLGSNGRAASYGQLQQAFRLRDMLLCQQVYLEAMLDYLDKGGGSRGSALYTDPEGLRPYAELPDEFIYKLDNGSMGDKVQEVCWNGSKCEFSWREVRAVPEDDDFFENVWREFRENGNVY
ncbi:FAD-binding protein [Lacrimispora sp.]|uniref:FAD-binding protein n=1 Tax=Lacrimispora sp. TaxID=2719234 RepID=UPI00345FB763